MRVGHVSDLKQKAKCSLFGLIVGEKSSRQRKGVEGFRVADTLGVAETDEPTLSVIATIATISYASEWKVAVEHMDDGVVDDKRS